MTTQTLYLNDSENEYVGVCNAYKGLVDLDIQVDGDGILAGQFSLSPREARTLARMLTETADLIDPHRPKLLGAMNEWVCTCGWTIPHGPAVDPIKRIEQHAAEVSR